MEFSLKNNIIAISSEKKEITLSPEKVVLDGLDIEVAGEYEKSGFLLYAFTRDDEQLYHFRVEGYWIAYVPTLITDISADALEFLGTVDVLVMPGAKAMNAVLEKIEPRLLVTYGDTSSEIATILCGMYEPANKYKLKESDLSSEKTGCIVLAE